MTGSLGASASLPSPFSPPATVIADYEMLSLSCILLPGKNFNVFVFVIRGPGLWDRPEEGAPQI